MVEEPGKNDWIPRPDPTRLTVQTIQREIEGLKEVVFTRLHAMDHALTIATDDLNRQPTEIEKAIQHLKDMLGARMDGMDVIRNEKFQGVQKQLEAFQSAGIQHNSSAATAISKSEQNFTKQIDQQGELIRSYAKNTEVQVGDIKERLTRIEGTSLGKTDTEKIHRDNTGLWIGLASALIAFLALALGAVGLFIANYHKV